MQKGTWRDAEDGHLSRNPIAQGSVDSTVGFHLHVPAGGVARATVWLACGDSREALVDLHDKIALKTARRMMDRTEAYWRLWALKEPIDFSPLPEPIRDMYVRSQLVLHPSRQRGHSGRQRFGHSNVRRRHVLVHVAEGRCLGGVRVGVGGAVRVVSLFFRFCDDIVEPSGWFRHKYNPNGTLASSWHPEVLDGRQVLAVQQDETAGVVGAARTLPNLPGCGIPQTAVQLDRDSVPTGCWSIAITTACRSQAGTCGKSGGASTPSPWPRQLVPSRRQQNLPVTWGPWTTKSVSWPEPGA